MASPADLMALLQGGPEVALGLKRPLPAGMRQFSPGPGTPAPFSRAEQQQEYGKVPSSIQQGQFQAQPDPWASSPDSSGFRQDLTQGSMAQDASARQMLDSRHAGAVRRIEQEDALRGDPMERQIAAEKQARIYEGLQPYPSEQGSSIYNQGGTYMNQPSQSMGSQQQMQENMRRRAEKEASDPRFAAISKIQEIMDAMNDPQVSPEDKKALNLQFQAYRDLFGKMFGRGQDFGFEPGFMGRLPGAQPAMGERAEPDLPREQ